MPLMMENPSFFKEPEVMAKTESILEHGDIYLLFIGGTFVIVGLLLFIQWLSRRLMRR